jgi:hypothetical protein
MAYHIFIYSELSFIFFLIDRWPYASFAAKGRKGERMAAGWSTSRAVKGSQCPKTVILYAVFFYVRYAVFYRDLEEIMAERGVEVDYVTLNRRVVKYAPLVPAEAARRIKSPAGRSWRMDETYFNVRRNGVTSIGQSINMAKPLISCCPSGATRLPPSSPARSATTAGPTLPFNNFLHARDDYLQAKGYLRLAGYLRHNRHKPGD